MEQSQGWFWCPRCCTRREFILAPGASSSDPDADLECHVCEFTYTTIKIERPNMPPERRHQLTREQRQAALAELRAEWAQLIRASGGRVLPGR